MAVILISHARDAVILRSHYVDLHPLIQHATGMVCPVTQAGAWLLSLSKHVLRLTHPCHPSVVPFEELNCMSQLLSRSPIGHLHSFQFWGSYKLKYSHTNLSTLTKWLYVVHIFISLA